MESIKEITYYLSIFNELKHSDFNKLVRNFDYNLKLNNMKKPKVKLTGTDGNVFALLGRCVDVPD